MKKSGINVDLVVKSLSNRVAKMAEENAMLQAIATEKTKEVQALKQEIQQKEKAAKESQETKAE
jgi:mannose/fructose-specific phosphotransferase system component IIA